MNDPRRPLWEGTRVRDDLKAENDRLRLIIRNRHAEKAIAPSKCANCGMREATIQWVGQDGVMDWYHDGWSPWCECCATQAQLNYAKQRAASIPELERKLAALKAA